MPEIVGRARAKRTAVRAFSASSQDRAPGNPAASVGFGGRQAAGTLQHAVQHEVHLQNVYARLAQDAELRLFGTLGNDGADIRFALTGMLG